MILLCPAKVKMTLKKGEISQTPEAKGAFKLLQILVKFVPEFAERVYQICMFLGAYVNIQRILLEGRFWVSLMSGLRMAHRVHWKDSKAIVL